MGWEGRWEGGGGGGGGGGRRGYPPGVTGSVLEL